METHPILPAAPEWSVWLAWFGRGLIGLGLLLFLISAIAGWRGALHWSSRALGFGMLALAGAFGLLGGLLVTDQFQFVYVFEHTDSITPVAYKIAGLWGGQEGSFLLWACCAALFGWWAARHTGPCRRGFTIVYALFLATLAGISSYESPFKLHVLDGRHVLPADGLGMQPSLLNYWVTIHPPTIFLGFGALTVLFAWAVAALAGRHLDDWGLRVRPWAILSATLLALGLCMGGFWAYETLGWGGFWAWDPVENTSFVPWCLTVALVHGLFVQAARRRWHYANALLAGLAALSFWYGTFLTRSGFLGDTSVHSFASMDRNALWLLVGLVGVSAVGFLALWAVRVRQAVREPAAGVATDEAITKSHAYGAAGWLLVGMGVAAGIGMSVPLAMSVLGRQPQVVEEALYHRVLVWLFVPIMLALAIGPFTMWRGTSARALWGRVSTLVALSLGFTGLALLAIKSPLSGFEVDPLATIEMPFGVRAPLLPWMGFLMWLSIFAVMANGRRLLESWRGDKLSLGGLVSHVGVAVLIAGLIVSRGFERKAELSVQEGRPAQGLGYTISYVGPTGSYTDRTNAVRFTLVGRNESFEVRPGLYYIQRPNGKLDPMVWPAIRHRALSDTYFTLGPMQFEATEPLTFKVGETKFVEDDLAITYEELESSGPAGQVGAVFAARLGVQTPAGAAHSSPSIAIGPNGLVHEPAPLTEELMVFLDRIDAADKSATLVLHWTKPVFPIALFYKPMTGLVWFGTGIMTFGGLMAALYRRKVLKASRAEPHDEPEPAPSESTPDAPIPTA